MTEDPRATQTSNWDDKKNNHKCIINIFCNDIKSNGMNDCKKNDSPCIINIFCNDAKNPNKCTDEEEW